MENINVKYIIDKSNRKVICLIENTREAFYHFMYDWNTKTDFVFRIDYKKYKMNNAFRGVATCSPNDEWDEKLGKQIAYARARYKFDRSFFNQANRFVNDVDARFNQMCDEINNYGRRIEEKYNYRQKKLEERFGEDFSLFNSDKSVAQNT